MNAELKYLEKVWMAEVEGRLPFQSKAAIMKRLEAQGLVEPMEVTLRGRSLPIHLKGWQLTHAGRFYYCSTCENGEAG